MNCGWYYICIKDEFMINGFIVRLMKNRFDVLNVN